MHEINTLNDLNELFRRGRLCDLEKLRAAGKVNPELDLDYTYASDGNLIAVSVNFDTPNGAFQMEA
ncbi:hypothetical protein LKL35_24235 [Streptomyces sp. ET3-23]|uniref:hypothetical protein n=1 Tax=Streptomyces sp. ET3-23 TaxID=2885643 RepID=UPI001D12CA90|nr:hypothetical protein [Streptomyces sp. ET3-23]MCC2278508.1 hypothetical protein [Streptomyces sp. ET3-23]